MKERFENQLAFIQEIDKLKKVFRQTYLLDGSRKENSAEHSWQISVIALILAEYADDKNLDLLKIITMLLIHDIVEIRAGDTYIYDPDACADQEKREQASADELFGLLPPDQACTFKKLWQEFEEGRSPEARFAKAVDRFQPLLHNHLTRGKAWQEHGVASAPVYQVNEKIRDGSSFLWEYTQGLVAESVDKGFLKK